MRSSPSPRWGNNALHGNSSSSQGPPPTSLRSTTAPGSSKRGGPHQAPSPRGPSIPSGSTNATKLGSTSARDHQQGSRAIADAREWGSGGRAPKAAGVMDGKEKDANGEDSAGRIRVAVRVSTARQRKKEARRTERTYMREVLGSWLCY